VEKRRARDFFGVVGPKETERGSGYLTRCIIEDHLRALLIAVDRHSADYPPSFAKFLRPTKERVEKCRQELSCFSENQIRNAGRDFVAHFSTPGMLADMMVEAVSAATQDSPVQLRSLRLPVGSWDKTLRGGLLKKLGKVRSRLGVLPDTTAVNSSPENPKRPNNKPQAHNGTAKVANTAPHPIAKEAIANETTSPRHKCLCGCNGYPKKGRFLSGHDSRLKSRLIKAARGGSEEALEKLQELNWAKFI
jgi:hypothetical protein